MLAVYTAELRQARFVMSLIGKYVQYRDENKNELAQMKFHDARRYLECSFNRAYLPEFSSVILHTRAMESWNTQVSS